MHRLAVVLAGALLGAGCGGATDDPSAATPAPSTADSPAATASQAPVDSLVTLEARWMCDVQRFSFTDLAEIQAELDGRLAASGFDQEAYQAFRVRLETEPALRADVLSGYRSYCDGEAG